jgi:hypothetical protein
MAKVPNGEGEGNDSARPGNGAGFRKQEGDPFSDLCERVKRLGSTRTNEDRAIRREELASFVHGLSAKERKSIRVAWGRLPLNQRQELHRELCSLGGSFGPAATLLHELSDHIEARVDELPSPRNDGPQLSETLLYTAFVSSGVSDAEARTMAAKEARRTPDDVLRSTLVKHGASPEHIESMVAEDRRHRKVRAVADTILHEELDAKDRESEGKLRPLVSEASELAARLVAISGELAWRLNIIAIDNAGLFRNRRKAQAGHPVPGLAWIATSENLWSVSERADHLTKELNALSLELARPAGGQEDAIARTAAKKLKADGLTLRQITDVLATHEIVPTSYTPENTRDLLRKSPKRGGSSLPRETQTLKK